MVRYHHITQSQPLPVGALRARHGGPFRPMSAHFVRGFEVLGAESAPFECRARRLPCNRCSGFPRNLRSAGGRRDVWSTGGDAARASTCCHRVGRARCGGVGATVWNRTRWVVLSICGLPRYICSWIHIGVRTESWSFKTSRCRGSTRSAHDRRLL